MNMIVKYVASITLEFPEANLPKNDSQWEKFNIALESIIEKALEQSEQVMITTAEVVMEEI